MPRKGMRSVFFRSNTTTTLPQQSPQRSSVLQSKSPNRYLSPLYSFSDSMLNDTFKAAEEMINKWNIENNIYTKVTSLFQENRKEAREFIKCVRDLQRAMNFLLFENANSEKLVTAHNLMQIAMKRLEKEFYQILAANRDYLDPESISSGRTSYSTSASFSDFEDDIGSEVDEIQIAGTSISKVEQMSAIAMSDIKMVAECMISSGYGKECVKIYKIIRKSIVDEGLYRLGIVHIKKARIRKMDWEVLEMKINNWLNAVKIAVKTLFHGERILCDHVFASSDAIRESCFTEIVKEGALILFGFPKKVAKSKKQLPERVFRILDLYNAVAELWPEIESVFSFESTSAVKSRALASLQRLGDAVRSMVSEFESSIYKDSSKSLIHGGGVHPQTRYVMEYLCHLSDYTVPLSNIVADWQLPTQSPLPESYFEYPDNNDPLSVRFAWLILVLLCKIDMKVGFYKDVSLSYLFLANNLHFVVTKVGTSNQRLIVGEDWISKHEAKVKQYVSNYEKYGWDKVLSTLPPNPTADLSPEEVKMLFKRFNSTFESIYRTQSSWVVPDTKLRDYIEVSICKKIVPVYSQFYTKYRDWAISEKLIKFTPDELTSHISGLFYKSRSNSSSSSSCVSSA
ncbi:Exocyst complex component exo70h1 [Thalictrum thalictroides]|uniref:Exocyst subunit Exo70 family protein n=1 Tax=Thalictrum thalictroides TaxID=46969 RepID=A0A7J6V6C9_THATH|nr:Exocyst complex component exo70h1 [Thalictrum thalictroides]